MLEISENSIKRFVNGVLESEIPYNIEIRESGIYGDLREMIIYENGSRHIFITNGSQLLLTGYCNDCFQEEYRRN